MTNSPCAPTYPTPVADITNQSQDSFLLGPQVLFLKKNILLINLLELCWVLVGAHEIFDLCGSVGIFSCGTLKLWHAGSSSLTLDGIWALSSLGAQCLSCWSTREVPHILLNKGPRRLLPTGTANRGDTTFHPWYCPPPLLADKGQTGPPLPPSPTPAAADPHDHG